MNPSLFTFDQKNTGVIIIDVQERLFPTVENCMETFEKIVFFTKASLKLQLPILATEQYPEGIGETISYLKDLLPNAPIAKTSFSAWREEAFKKAVVESGKKSWVVFGLEAHVCVLQTARDLVTAGFEVVVLNDATSSQSIFDYSIAISEIKEWARVSSASTILFELIGDSKHPQFKECLHLLKQIDHPKNSSCCRG